MNKIVIACFLAAALLLVLALAIALMSEETDGAGRHRANEDLERLLADQSNRPNGEETPHRADQPKETDQAGAEAGSGRSDGSTGAGEQSGNTGPSVVDLNTATLEELDLLPGIGPVKAQAIIDYRSAAGGFYSTEELMEVKGIGPKTYERLKERITVTKPPQH